MWFKNFRARRKQNEVYSEKQKKHNNNNHLMDKSNRSFKKKKIWTYHSDGLMVPVLFLQFLQIS